MKIHKAMLTITAALIVVCSADPSWAEKKKSGQAAKSDPFKECCEKANARLFEWNGKRTCRTQSERQTEAFQECSVQRNQRIISRGSHAP
jgi:hypothetical protein